LPVDAINPRIHDTFGPPAKPELPADAAAWAKQRQEWIDALRTDVFAGWPSKPPPLAAKLAADVSSDGVRLRGFDYVSEDDVPLRVWVMTADAVAKPELVMLAAVDEAAWRDWLKELGPAFAAAFPGGAMPPREPERFEQTRRALSYHKW